MPFIIDAHEDIAWNMLALGRDPCMTAHDIRKKEENSQIPSQAGDALLGWPDYQVGQVALVFGSLFTAPQRFATGAWDTLVYSSPAEAKAINQRQVDAYKRLCDENPTKFRRILNQRDLTDVLSPWKVQKAENPAVTHPVGILTLMEGAEGVDSPGELEEWWQEGVRIIGLVWAGTRYAGGTRQPGPLTVEGKRLLGTMAELGFVLDVSHMSDQSILEAVDSYNGLVVATHANARALLKGTTSVRHLTNKAIERLVERDAVIGVIPYNRFLVEGWQKTDNRSRVTLQHVVDHLDHICQIAGDFAHVGLGSDFDGGFGWPAVPEEIDTIADLQKLTSVLARRGYNEDAITAIFHGNWQRFLEKALPS